MKRTAMASPSFTQKKASDTAPPAIQAASAGPLGTALTPPAYGIAVVDGGVLQRAAVNSDDVNSVPPIVHDVLRSPGQPLDAATRAFMEPRFGHDFSQVQVHTDARAAESARAVHALAYTVGRDVVFGAGQYELGTHAGQRLMAHELTHVVQQATTPVPQSALTINRANSPAESEARWAGERVANGYGLAGMRSQAISGLARQPTGAEAQGEAEKEEGPGFWASIGGGLIGEFNEDPSLAMIGVDLGVSLIPVLDQVSDVRDILAHLYYLIFHNQYDRFMRWIGLVFTLIGLIPEVGSAIKGASKFVIRGVSEVLSRLAEFLRPFRQWLGEAGDIGVLQRYIAHNWDSWVSKGVQAWNSTINRITNLLARIPTFLRGRIQIIREGIARVQQLAPQKIAEAFAWVRRQWDNIAERLRQRGGRSANEGETASDVVVRSQRVRISVQHLHEWERAGGHALQRHAPFHTRETLLQRLFNEHSLGGLPASRPLPGGGKTTDFQLWQGKKVRDASAWKDESAMLDSLTHIINDNIGDINNVTSRGGEIVLEGVDLGRNVGRGWVTAIRDQGERAIHWSEELQRATVVIRPRPGGGWFVFTAFPHL
jgi:hypothetical protein